MHRLLAPSERAVDCFLSAWYSRRPRLLPRAAFNTLGRQAPRVHDQSRTLQDDTFAWQSRRVKMCRLCTSGCSPGCETCCTRGYSAGCKPSWNAGCELNCTFKCRSSCASGCKHYGTRGCTLGCETSRKPPCEPCIGRNEASVLITSAGTSKGVVIGAISTLANAGLRIRRCLVHQAWPFHQQLSAREEANRPAPLPSTS